MDNQLQPNEREKHGAPPNSEDERVIREVLPTHFNWPLFAVALGLMSVPVVAESWPGCNRLQPAQTQT